MADSDGLRGDTESPPARPGATRLIAMVVAFTALVIGWRIGRPLYRAEALRYNSRHMLDVQARDGNGELRKILPPVVKSFEQATN